MSRTKRKIYSTREGLPQHMQKRMPKTYNINSYDDLIANAWDFDIESLRNFFSVVFTHCITREKRVFVIFGDRDDSVAMVDFVDREGIVLVGYNTRSYDCTVLNRIIWMVRKEKMTRINPIKIYNFSQMVIKERDTYVDIYKSDGHTPVSLRLTPKHRKAIKTNRWADWQKYQQVDLIEQTIVNANRPSLKHCAIHLHHHRIQDLPFEYTRWLTAEEAAIFIDYNENDVVITRKLRIAKRKQLELRISIAETFGIDLWRCINASDSKLANVILESLWGGKPQEKATHRRTLRMDDLIGHWVKFDDPELQALEHTMRRVVLKQSNKYKWKKEIDYAGVTYAVGIGGLHSKDKPRTVRSGDGYHYFELDFGSYYPGIILSLGLFPEHLGKKFLEIYRKIVEDRLFAKMMEDVIRASALKITANGIFGKMLSLFFWLYDPKAPLTVTVTGQLTLFMLVEKLLKIGVETLSANTDGILVKAHDSQLAEIDKIAQGFSKEIDIPLEYTRYNVFSQRDVNSYVGEGQECKIETVDGVGTFVPVKKPKVKVKGALSNGEFGDYGSINYNRGYSSPIVATAARDYFINGIKPEETIAKYKGNHHMFMLTQKVGKDFQQFLINAHGETPLQKTNRIVVADRAKMKHTSYPTGSYIKRKWDNKKKRMKDHSIIAKQYVALCNDLTDEVPPVNYDWYKQAAWDLIDIMNNAGQMSIFGAIKEKKAQTEILDFFEFDRDYAQDYELVK